MLTVETIGRIRREHFIKGKTIKEIARDLKVYNNIRFVGCCGRVGHPLSSNDFSPDQSSGDGMKNSTGCLQGTRPSLRESS